MQIEQWPARSGAALASETGYFDHALVARGSGGIFTTPQSGRLRRSAPATLAATCGCARP